MLYDESRRFNPTNESRVALVGSPKHALSPSCSAASQTVRGSWADTKPAPESTGFEPVP